MTKINDGGPAFPTYNAISRCDEGGASLRDYFAAKAMAALIISCADKTFITRNDECAEAYNYADTMLKARENNT